MDEFFVRNRLSAYLDGELPLNESREVEAALARHPHLRDEYEHLRAAVELLRREGPLRAPPRLTARLAERLGREPLRSGWWARARAVRPEVWALAAAAVLGVVVVGKSGLGRHEAERGPVAAAVPLAPEAKEVAPPVVPATPTTADGVLGDEVRPLGAGAKQTFAEAPVTSKMRGSQDSSRGKKVLEKEPFQADWEQAEAANTGAAANPAAENPAAENTATGNTATTQAVAYSGPPFRYRLQVQGDDVLKQLHAAARDLGGTLTDANGKPLSDYPMEEGEKRSVQIKIPTYNVEALVARLRSLGLVDELAAERDVLYAPGAQVPVSIYVVRE